VTDAEAPPATPPPEPPPPAEKPPFDWRGELKAILLLALGVLALHTFIAKPFYIPSESMMPGLIKGDRLVVTKYPYGWSWVSPTFHVLPETRGRLFGRMPERGDVVILLPTGAKDDWIKRVIGVPGDSLAMRAGQLYLNGRPVRRERRPDTVLPVDANLPCDIDPFGEHRSAAPDGRMMCRLPVYRETLPSGRAYDTIDEGATPADDFGPVTVPAGSVFLMGDNRDNSADSRVPAFEGGLGGPVRWENIGGRAEFILYSYDGSFRWYNPLSWFSALRGGRAGTSLRSAPAS
jgi:signal peptidase I